MELQCIVCSYDVDWYNFSNNENLWINIQYDLDEVCSQLVVLCCSVLKLIGEVLMQLQLLFGFGCLCIVGSQLIEVVCDVELLLVWFIVVILNIGLLKVWEYDVKGGDWCSLVDVQQCVCELLVCLMCFISLFMEKILFFN